MDSNITDRIQQLVSEGETEAAIIELTEWARTSRQPDWVKQCILIRARWEQLQKEKAAGILDDDDLYRQANQINSAVLDLLDYYPANRLEVPARKRAFLWTGLAVAGLLFMAVLVFRQVTQTGETVADTPATSIPSEKDLSYSFSWPEGKITHLARGDGDIITYEIRSASVESFDSQNNKLTFEIRCSLKSRYPINFWDGNFRFQIMESVSAAPQSGLNEFVEGDSYKDGVIWFILPKNTRKGQLNISLAGTATYLPVAW